MRERENSVFVYRNKTLWRWVNKQISFWLHASIDHLCLCISRDSWLASSPNLFQILCYTLSLLLYTVKINSTLFPIQDFLVTFMRGSVQSILCKALLLLSHNTFMPQSFMPFSILIFGWWACHSARLSGRRKIEWEEKDRTWEEFAVAG